MFSNDSLTCLVTVSPDLVEIGEASLDRFAVGGVPVIAEVEAAAAATAAAVPAALVREVVGCGRVDGVRAALAAERRGGVAELRRGPLHLESFVGSAVVVVEQLE